MAVVNFQNNRMHTLFWIGFQQKLGEIILLHFLSMGDVTLSKYYQTKFDETTLTCQKNVKCYLDSKRLTECL